MLKESVLERRGREHREPLIRMAERASISPKKAWTIRAIALLGALIVGGLLILVLGHNPFAVYANMLQGAFGRKIAIQETVKVMIPLLVTGIAISLAFKMRFWNIGAQGQILMGGVAATAVVVYGQAIPQVPRLILMAAAAIVAGGLYGAIPAVFKAKWNTNETLFTLMLNYIAIQLIVFLYYQPNWQMAGTSFPKIRTFDIASRLPRVFGVHIGWIIALVLVVAAYFYISKTKQGYEISVVGESPNTARYAGMSVAKVIIRTMFISAAIAGLVGFLQVAGADGTLTESTGGDAGFTAITVAWLAKMNPFGMVVVSLFIAVLMRGSNSIQTAYGIPASAASLLTGLILFFMLGCEFFISYRLIFRRRGREEEAQ